MMNIQDNGKLEEWYSDSIQWLQATFGRENVVAAHLHMDEKRPHIHAAVVPIVRGGRRKVKKEREERTDKLKSVATDTATALASRMGSLFGSKKIKSWNEKTRT